MDTHHAQMTPFDIVLEGETPGDDQANANVEMLARKGKRGPVSAPTMLRFQLRVSDGQVSSSPDEVEITLLPAKPVMGPHEKVYLPVLVK